ncbi:aminotransferase class I/II-fold pyridoxal phosphate-dependent enzyme [Candidatus Haliotispira prima]|uniref:Aminotransferase class I/II-fold pyridoxal phosphate-dependent enzyme n=1 Tax=Candidatus Haliotispira prima TaxID=3034016 RepID=A0ABY8MIS7_9SPIO|nr:aminotransferase class I/II-fold pyridoxal phosphate-dependent enzyme [Candidatus Haliotispira prima]
MPQKPGIPGTKQSPHPQHSGCDTVRDNIPDGPNAQDGQDNKMARLLSRARPNIQRLKPYSSARLHASAEELQSSILLNANENPYPPPGQPADCPGGAGDTKGYNYYPEPQPRKLVEALALLYGVHSEQIIVGRGSDEGIDLLIRAFCGEQDAIAICSPTFGMYRSYAEIQGCRIIDIPLEIRERPQNSSDQASRTLQTSVLEAKLPLTALRRLLETAEAPGQTPKLLFIPSPLAPLGSLIPKPELLELLELCAANDILLVADEAYAEFARVLHASGEDSLPDQGYHSLMPLLSRYPNLVILRTLSKAYGLAGERIGSLVAAAPLVKMLRSAQSPYPVPGSVSRYVSCLIQDAAAMRSMAAHIKELCSEQQKLFAFLQTLPYVEKVFCSATNFIMIQVVSRQGPSLLQHCREQNFILRDFSRSLEGAIRISVGNAPQMERLCRALKSFPALQT